MQTAERNAFLRACPQCGGDVHAIASKCKHCGAPAQAETTAPPTVDDRNPAAQPAPIVTQPSPPPTGRWVWFGGATLLLAIGMALGVLIERASHEQPTADTTVVTERTFTAPRTFVPKPDLDLGPSVDEFVQQLGGELCSKLSDCADVDPAVGILCRTIAGSVDTDDLVAKVDRGECSYDAGAAASCIGGLARIDCDSDQQNPLAMLLTIESIMSCVEAVNCSSW